MRGMVYKWREGSRMPIAAQVAGEEIETLRLRANGDVTPAQVVDAARPEASPLHPVFEWDDSAAAEAYRREQARGMIGALTVTVKPAEKHRDVRAFVNVTRPDSTQGYTSLHAAMRDQHTRQQIVARAWSELQAWHERYRAYTELAAVHAVIEGESQKIAG